MSEWVLTRNDTKQAVSFAQDMRWVDEFAWAAVAQSAPVRSLSGAIIVQQGLKLAGRPITLSGDWVWHKRQDLLTLREWTDEPELQMSLSHYDGRQFNVIWRLHETAITAEPVHYLTPELEGEPYTATLNLMTI